MKISDKIYIDLHKEKVDANIYEALTYENPEYFQKMNLGLSLWNVPKKILSYTIDNTENKYILEICRGEALKIKPFIQDLDYNFDHQDHPIKLQYINNDFKLDEYQEGAVEAIKGKRQGIIHAVTSAGKSLIILKAITEIGQKAVIVVHRKILMEQLLTDIKKYIRDENGKEIEVGIVGNGKRTYGDITIAIDKSFSKHIDEDRDKFGVAILDECHLAPANTIFNLLNSINSKFRFGFSGTLKRKDQKEFLIFSTFGQVIYSIGKDELLENNRIVPVKVKVVETETKFDWDSVVEGLVQEEHKNPTLAARALRDQTIALDPDRNSQILDLASRLPGKTIILSKFVEPCYSLHAALKEHYGLDAGVITGRDAKEALESYKAMKEKNMRVIFATIGCVSTGVSISDLDNIILISPIFTNELLLHQIRGRLMRSFEGKTHGTLYFLFDPYIFPNFKLSKFLKIIHS